MAPKNSLKMTTFIRVGTIDNCGSQWSGRLREFGKRGGGTDRLLAEMKMSKASLFFFDIRWKPAAQFSGGQPGGWWAGVSLHKWIPPTPHPFVKEGAGGVGGGGFLIKTVGRSMLFSSSSSVNQKDEASAAFCCSSLSPLMTWLAARAALSSLPTPPSPVRRIRYAVTRRNFTLFNFDAH